MLDAALLAAYVLACALIAAGVAAIYGPAGMITGGALLLATVIRVSRAPAPARQPERDEPVQDATTDAERAAAWPE